MKQTYPNWAVSICVLAMLAATPAAAEEGGSTAANEQAGVQRERYVVRERTVCRPAVVEDRPRARAVPIEAGTNIDVVAEFGEWMQCFRLYVGMDHELLGHLDDTPWFLPRSALIPEDDAIAHFSALIERKPHDAELYMARGRAYSGLREYELANADFEAARANGGACVSIGLAQGWNFYDGGEFPEAIRVFSETLKCAPDDPRLYYGRGRVHEANANYPLAVADFARAVQLQPKSPLLLEALGMARYEMGDYKSAYLDVDASIQNGGLDHFMRGRCSSRLGKYVDAIMDYSFSIARDPRSYPGLTCLSWTLSTCPDESLRNGRRALELAERSRSIFEGNLLFQSEAVAAAHAELGNFEEAVKWQQRALDLGLYFDDEDRRPAELRLELYKQHKPYRTEGADDLDRVF